MPDQITKLLDQIDLLDQRATKGPWFSESKNEDDYYALTAVYNVFHNGDTPDRDLMAYGAYDNAEFIALARATLPKLAEAVYQVLALLDAEENRPSRIAAIDGLQRPARVPTSEVRQTITDSLGDDDD